MTEIVTDYMVQERAFRLVEREVFTSMSSVVSILAQAYGLEGELGETGEQAMELQQAVEDWKEAAEQMGWEETSDGKDGGQHVFTDSTDGQTWCAENWEALCRDHDIEPYGWEVYEHWSVSEYLADKLEAHGEKVDRDFCGMNVWARTSTGQAIHGDSVMLKIAREMLA